MMEKKTIKLYTVKPDDRNLPDIIIQADSTTDALEKMHESLPVLYPEIPIMQYSIINPEPQELNAIIIT